MAETELETLSHSNANPTSYRLYIPMPFKKKKSHILDSDWQNQHDFSTEQRNSSNA